MYFTQVGQAGATGALDLTFEYDATALAEEVLFRAGTGRYVQLQFNGTVLQTTSAPWTTKALRIDAYGKILSKQSLDSQDGNDVMAMTLQLCDEDTNNLFLNFSLVNSLATVP